MPRAATRPIARADWMAARALLATRRLRPVVPYALGTFALLLGAVWMVRGPLADRAVAAQRSAGRLQAAERDTAPLVSNVLAAQRKSTQADSLLRTLLFRAETWNAAPALSVEARRERDSLSTVLTQLTAALDRAAKAPLAASYRVLAGTDALRPLAAVQVLVDTLDLLEKVRQTLDPAAAPTSEFAQLSARANAIGATLQGIGQERQSTLVRQIEVIDATGDRATRGVAGSIDTGGARAARDGARRAVTSAESLLRDARQWHAQVQARADSDARARAARILGASPFVVATSALLVVSVLLFALAVVAETRVPTISHAREVERITGLPVLASATAFRVPREGRARLQPGTGVDPFRMVYLSLTASGTRERVVCVTGDEVSRTVAVAARLAVSAAADERATLVVDLAPGVPSTSAFFGWRDEPGFTEAIAGVRLWREVARPVGASEGLAIDVIPAGGIRADTPSSVQNAIARSEFVAFLGEYDFTVLAAPTASAAGMAASACGSPPTILVARIARTRLRVLQSDISGLRTEGVNLHGILLIDR
ncbi:MAG: P-loop NTPase family protein [Gemmatimonadaceae bacterium]